MKTQNNNQEQALTKSVNRTSFGLRDALFDEIDMLRQGLSTPQKAGAVSRVADQIIKSVKIEIEHQKHVATVLNAGNKVTPSATLKLGSESVPS